MAGRYEECGQLCVAGLSLAPDDEQFLLYLGISLQSRGQFDAAADAFRRLTVLHPDVAEYWANLGLMLRYQTRFAEAEAKFRKALLLPHQAHGTMVNYGLLLRDMGRIADARHQFLDACEIEGHSADARIYAALTCIDCGDTARADTLIPPINAWPSLEPALRRELAGVLMLLGRVTEAEALLHSDAHDLHDPMAIAWLASLYERTNRIGEASALLERIRDHEHLDVRLDALTLDGTMAIRAKDYARARIAAKAALGFENLPAQERANAHFMMATVADKEGQVAEAMLHLASAHRIRFELAAAIEPDIAASADEPLRIASKWLSQDQSHFQRGAADPTVEQSPVFIVGFPRSGTTMLEQMLDAHPDYVSMDERIIIQDCVGRMESMGFTYPDQLEKLTSTDLVELRALYWSQTSKVVHRADHQILVDKNPLNMLRLPMIRRLFPSARIILAVRHPCDVILSCYMQNFRSPAFMILCSTLERLAKSYANAMRFWIHHQPLLPPSPLILRYEETVGDFPAQVERIARFLRIEDRSYLADFTTHAAAKGYISTPSYSQVVESVNRRAVERWLPYRSYFEPAFPILRPVAEHWGYSLPKT